MVPLAKFGTWSASWKKKLNNRCPCAQALCTGAFFTFYLFPYLVLRGIIIIFRAIPHNSKCRYGERGAADAKPKAQIILDAAKVSAASGGYSEPKQEQRSQSARGFCPRSTMRVPQPDIIEHFGNADAVPQPPERCLSRQAGIVRYCHNVYSPKSCATFLSISRMGKLYGQRVSHLPQPMQAPAFTVRVSYRSCAQPARP